MGGGGGGGVGGGGGGWVMSANLMEHLFLTWTEKIYSKITLCLKMLFLKEKKIMSRIDYPLHPGSEKNISTLKKTIAPFKLNGCSLRVSLLFGVQYG